jgi:transcriptional regulator with XRE-family HTH domain
MTALHTAEYRRFAAALAEARRASGLSQYALADRLGVPQFFISKYESGRRRLDVIEFLRIAQAIGIDPAEFLRSLGADIGAFSSRSVRRT